MTGGLAALAVVVILAPSSAGSPGHLALVIAMAKIAAWIVAPSMVLTVVSGLLAMVANPIYLDVGWVWAKAATGILVLIGGVHVVGPLQDAAKRGVATLANNPDAAALEGLAAGETTTLWVLLAVALVNIALGVWRPRFPRYRV
jgi:uncharacterized membrane protein